MECPVCEYDEEDDVLQFKTIGLTVLTDPDNPGEGFKTDFLFQYICPKCGVIQTDPASR